MLTPFSKESKTFTFRDNQTITLKEPTLIQLQSAKNKGKNDDLEIAKHLLIDMSDGELTEDFLNTLPAKEFTRLTNEVAKFMGLELKD